MYKHPRWILGLCLVVTVFLGLGIPQIKFDNDVRAMLPEGNADVAVNNYYESEDVFGNSNLIFIGIESKDAYSAEALNYVRDLRAKIEALNDTLPLANLAKLLDLTPEEAQKAREGLGNLGWNAASAGETLQPYLDNPGALGMAAGFDASIAKKVVAWVKTHHAVDLFRTWEAPIKTIQSLTDADDIVNEDDTLKVQKFVEGDLTPEAVAGLRAKVESWPVYKNALVSADGTMAAWPSFMRENASRLFSGNCSAARTAWLPENLKSLACR